MWWLPLVVATIIGLGVIVLQYAQTRRDISHTKIYRARFQQLVSQLDQVTQGVNHLGRQAAAISDVKILDYYESCLRILQTLLETVRKVHPFGSDPTILNSAFFLARDCRARVERTRKAFTDAGKGRPIDFPSLYGQPKQAAEAGCYFCSRPVVTSRFSRVKVRIDDQIRDVLSCHICRQELEQTKKIKVLYFMHDGKQVHWSEMADYLPSEDYWNINKRNPMHRMTKLELVRGTNQIPEKDKP